MKLTFFISFFLCFLTFNIHSQTLNNEQIKESVVRMNKDLPYTIPGTNVVASSVSSLGRNLIFTYLVPEGWYPSEDMKEQVINSISEQEKRYYDKEKINLTFHYSRNNNIVERVTISYKDFKIAQPTSLGNYISYKSHPKSKGVNIKIKNPLGFEKLEGDRPNIVAKYSNKENNLVYTLLIVDMPMFFSRNNVQDFVFVDNSSTIAKEFLSAMGVGGNYVSSRYMKIDNYPTLEYIFDLEREILEGLKLKMRSINWVIYYEDKMIQLGGMASQENFDQFKHIFSIITNSVVFEDQYNYPGSNRIYDSKDFEDFVNKFYRELEVFGINKVRPKNTNISLKSLDNFKDTSHLHGFSLGSNNDDVIKIYINERSWNSFTKAQKHYLIFHELCHDVLNLDDLSFISDEKNIMYPSIHNFKDLTMDDFIENFHNLLEKY